MSTDAGAVGAVGATGPRSNAGLFERAQAVIPGGVNSPVRAFRAVGGTPRFIARAQGPYLFDAEGTRYIDYIGSWGPMILGHGHPAVLEAVQKAAVDGLSFGAPTEREIELAEAILAHVPSMQQIRLVSSGTEAAMSALRLARGATGRSKIVKFEGCYHGHADALLVKAGSGLATFGHPTSAGVPPEVVQHTLVLEYNNLAQLDEAFALHGDEIACVMIEPIAGNMNFVRASVPFVERLRELCSRWGALLVFDEVMSGFRVALGSAQSLYAAQIPGFEPDISVFGKVIGGGMPLAAFGAKRAVMQQLAPLGAVYQAGTLSGNPVATACGLATLREIEKPGFFEALSASTRVLLDGLLSAARDAGVPMVGDCEGGMFGFFFPVTDGTASLAPARLARVGASPVGLPPGGVSSAGVSSAGVPSAGVSSVGVSSVGVSPTASAEIASAEIASASATSRAPTHESPPAALPQNYTEVMATDRERFNRFFHAMLERGIYLAPAMYEAGFVSAAHSAADLRATIAAARSALG